MRSATTHAANSMLVKFVTLSLSRCIGGNGARESGHNSDLSSSSLATPEASHCIFCNLHPCYSTCDLASYWGRCVVQKPTAWHRSSDVRLSLDSKSAPISQALALEDLIQCTTPAFRLYNILIPSPSAHYHTTTNQVRALGERLLAGHHDLVKFRML